MTDFAMPPVVPHLPSDEVDDDEVAFKVLNKDNLPIIIGQPLLKPFNTTTENKQKPNGIVYPTRRITTNLEENKEKNFTKSNGYINNPSSITEKKPFFNSHGNLNHTTNSATKNRPESNLDTKFTKALDAKLRKLQKDEKHHFKKTPDSPRKPFVTTVKIGQFLEPPPERANLLGIRAEKTEEPLEKKEGTFYAYASKPRVLNRTPTKTNNVHRKKCSAAAIAAAVHEGVHISDFNSNVAKKMIDSAVPYANLMVEKRVYRGSNFAPTLSGHQGDGESAAARAAEARRRALARRKAKNQQFRATQLRLGSPPPVPGRKHEPVQTEQYLEEIWEHTPVADVCTQTDLFLERPISPFYVPSKTGEDVETQIYPGDLFDFDLEVQPILEVLVGKTIEQALIEVLEEEELAALKEQQRRFLEMRAVETSEAQRLQEREKRLRIEKEKRLLELEEGSKIQKELEERIAASVLMQGYIADLLPSVLEGLEIEGVLADNLKKDVDEAFIPWLMKEVTQELTEMVSSRDILADIIREILENRSEIYNALNREVSKEESEEEGPTQDIALEDHLKLQVEIKEKLLENEQ